MTRILEFTVKAVKNPKLAFHYLYTRYFIDQIPKTISKLRYLGQYKTYSQAYQDVFVRLMLENKKNGMYVEVGAYDEVDHSNTYILEKLYKWSGISFEIDDVAASDFNSFRKNHCICEDATKFDFLSFFESNNFPKQIDYLSLDIEPAYQTLAVLKSLPLDRYRFSVITYEHDKYVSGPECMIESRKIFESYGYKLVVSNVCWEGRDFEDWYVDPSVVPEHIYREYMASNITFSELYNSKRAKS